MTGEQISPELRQLARGLKALLLDVDGVLTDGGIIILADGGEAKQFDVQDGMGINIARAAGLTVGIVTSRSSKIVERRAGELGIEIVFQGVKRKPEVLDVLLQKYGAEASQISYIGDDIQDIPIMKLVGIPIAVQNAVQQVKDTSVHVTKSSGGHGAVREAVEWLLDLRGDRDEVYRSIIGDN